MYSERIAWARGNLGGWWIKQITRLEPLRCEEREVPVGGGAQLVSGNYCTVHCKFVPGQ